MSEKKTTAKEAHETAEALFKGQTRKQVVEHSGMWISLLTFLEEKVREENVVKPPSSKHALIVGKTEKGMTAAWLPVKREELKDEVSFPRTPEEKEEFNRKLGEMLALERSSYDHKDFCFSCGRPFLTKEAGVCPDCTWFKCPNCHDCLCSLMNDPKTFRAVIWMWLSYRGKYADDVLEMKIINTWLLVAGTLDLKPLKALYKGSRS